MFALTVLVCLRCSPEQKLLCNVENLGREESLGDFERAEITISRHEPMLNIRPCYGQNKRRCTSFVILVQFEFCGSFHVCSLFISHLQTETGRDDSPVGREY